MTGKNEESWMGNWSTDTILKRNKTSMGEGGGVDCKSDKLGLGLWSRRSCSVTNGLQTSLRELNTCGKVQTPPVQTTYKPHANRVAESQIESTC